MSKLAAGAGPDRPRRADAVRSRNAILSAAVLVLNGDPDAGLSQVARVAGLTRQTVYAHFPTRQALVDAVVEQVTADLAGRLSDARPEQLPPVQALTVMLDLGWLLVDRYPLLLHLAGSADPQQSLDRHEPVLAQFEAVISRGQSSGDFDPQVPASWLVAAAVALTDGAAAEVQAGRMTAVQAQDFTRRVVLRALAAGGRTG